MAVIDIDGGVPSTTLNGGVSSGDTSLTLAAGAGYPDGTNGNFYVVVGLGAATEETIECSSRSSNTLTVANRGADGTSATAHDSGATVQHVVPAVMLQEANTHANATTGTPHGAAYVVPSGNVATATALATGRTVVLSGDVSGTSGSFDGTANATITTTVADDSHDHTDSTITGTLSNDTTGLAATATALATARTIGGVSFDGTANIDLPGVNTAGNQATSGNAATASKWSAATTLTLAGDATGSVVFDGSDTAETLTVAVVNNSHTHNDTTIDGLDGSAITSGTVADAYIDSTITRDSEAAAAYYAGSSGGTGRKITPSTSSPFGGSNGDIWLKY